ncbi:hypothetical protein GAY30_15710 [Azospirillum brasilense]|nr:hypothetical protein [Azospirillum brasilense]NUB33928.1 hypothetical protein [Azospirillum brasilense]RIV98712.1 hypothetical protein D2T81_25425 [Azospirillum brasilense]
MPKTRRSKVSRRENKGLTDRFGSSRQSAPTRRTGLWQRSVERAAVLLRIAGSWISLIPCCEKGCAGGGFGRWPRTGSQMGLASRVA